jgi:hypothetical protein
MGANITSDPTVMQSLTLASYSVSWTGTLVVGAFSVQASNDFSIDPEGRVQNAGTWNTLTLNYGGSPVTSIPVSGGSGTGFIDLDPTAAYAIRLVYTRTSGTGTMTATIVGKVA